VRSRGDPSGHVILEYGDYECPYSRKAYRNIQRVEARLQGRVGFAFRHFPLTEIHPHALAAACAAEAAALQDRFWEMHDRLFHGQKALEDEDLRAYAAELGLDPVRFDEDRDSDAVRTLIASDVDSGIATGEVRGTPTIFIDGVVHSGPYDADALLEALR
jgi:protein-disulfide isomerase